MILLFMNQSCLELTVSLVVRDVMRLQLARIALLNLQEKEPPERAQEFHNTFSLAHLESKALSGRCIIFQI